MRWIAALALSVTLCAPANAAADALDCPGRPWPKVDTVEVKKTTEGGKPVVTKTGYFQAENAIAPAELYYVWQRVSGYTGERWTATNYVTMGRLSCLYDYTYEWMARRGKPFRVVSHFIHAARVTPKGGAFAWAVDCFVETRVCHLQPHTGRIYGDDAFLLVAFSDKHPDGEVCVRGAPRGKSSVSILADGQSIATVGPAPGRDKYVCLDAASTAALAAIKGARRITYERAEIETTGLTEALDFARKLRERVVMAEGHHEKEQRMRANADARLAAATE
ncbi:MAG: hypothetical protein SGI91_18170 [Alphaproteobacteria bacterium]|nr:hypothetical protein [Alphaproteobacteria bacterium]